MRHVYGHHMTHQPLATNHQLPTTNHKGIQSCIHLRSHRLTCPHVKVTILDLGDQSMAAWISDDLPIIFLR